MAESRPLNH